VPVCGGSERTEKEDRMTVFPERGGWERRVKKRKEKRKCSSGHLGILGSSRDSYRVRGEARNFLHGVKEGSVTLTKKDQSTGDNRRRYGKRKKGEFQKRHCIFRGGKIKRPPNHGIADILKR